MSQRRVTSLNPANAAAIATLVEARQRAMSRLQGDWTGGELLELPRAHWFSKHREVWAVQVFTYGTITVWLTCENELWWQYQVDWRGEPVLEPVPADADAERVRQITAGLNKISLVAA